MDSEFVHFISSLTAGSWLRLVLTIVLTTGSVLMVYGVEIGYQLLVGCNLVTVAGTFFLESRSERIPRSLLQGASI